MLFDRKAGRALVISAFVLLGLLLMGSSCSVVGDDLQELADLQAIADHDPTPVWWKDGSRIVFASLPGGIYVVDPEIPDRLTTFPRGAHVGNCLRNLGAFSPDLSPDGSRLAYVVAKRDGRSEIMTAAVDGSDARRLTKDKGVHVHPTWSPDGTQIAFMSGSTYGTKDLHVMDADGSNVRMIAETNYVGAYPPMWSPDGSRIAFVGRDESRNYIVYTVRPDGSDLIEIGNTQSDPAWSPDGSRIAFLRVIVNYPKSADKILLTIVDPDGSNGRDLASWERGGRRWIGSLSWSPDGSKIVYGAGHFVIVSADGSGTPVRVSSAAGLGTTGGGAAWSPDGSRIAFLSQHKSSSSALFTTASDGSDRRILAKTPGMKLPSDVECRAPVGR